MDRLGFIDFNTRLSPENSGKASSYATAIQILDEVLKHQKVINLHGRSLYDIEDVTIIKEVLEYVKVEVGKMRKSQPNIFDYGNPNQRSYPLNNFCSAALNSLIRYAEFEHDNEVADIIVANETNPRTISKKLLNHFDINKDGEDYETMTKHRKGQEYFRRMILSIYGSRCAITGLDIPQTLRASHIVEWSSDIPNRMNPENGLCLSATYDAAFDKHLISFDDDYRMIVSKEIKDYYTNEVSRDYFAKFEGKQITLPTLYLPSKKFLKKHREKLVG